MPVVRSSVRPESCKQPWGTIIPPEYGLGHQKMTAYEVDQTVSRLHHAKERSQRYYERYQQADLTKQAIDDMVERLSQGRRTDVADSNRTQKNSAYQRMGVVNSYAWKGYKCLKY